jgi:hypothetical protein
MSNTQYDPKNAPDPGERLALDESERLRLAKNFHIFNRIKTPNLKGHAAFHVVIENQIAMGYGPSCRAVERLQQQGLSRHDTIHAIGSVVAKFLHESLTFQETGAAETMQSRMNAAVESLSATEWLASGDG